VGDAHTDLRPWLAVAAVAMGLLLAAAGTAWVTFRDEPPRESDRASQPAEVAQVSVEVARVPGARVLIDGAHSHYILG
jgi:hypothetical protein